MPSEINNFITDDFEQCLYVLDQTFTTKMVIDVFSDLVWTERYRGYGEFEVTMPVSDNVLANCHMDDYMALGWTDTLMIVETIATHTDPVNGDTMTISGRSLESILDRRILLNDVFGSILSDGTPTNVGVHAALKTMITNYFISPTDTKRRIPKFSFKDSTDSRVTSLTMGSFRDRGANVYDKIKSICDDKDLGFRINAIDGGGFQFELYFGTDRSWDQEDRFPVTFSDSFENLINSDYLESKTNYKSVVYIGWDWHYDMTIPFKDGEETKYTTIPRYGDVITDSARSTDAEGLARREFYVDDENGTYEIGNATNISKYTEQVRNKGPMYLTDYDIETMFEGDVEYARQFVYGKDYFLGDIVQLENKYGQTGKCRVTEIVFTWNASGQSLTPTFSTLEKGK